MEKIVKNFEHYPGVHCESTALRDVFAYHGIKIREPMVFGLGEGLSFIYCKSRQMPFPFVGGRTKSTAGLKKQVLGALVLEICTGIF